MPPHHVQGKPYESEKKGKGEDYPKLSVGNTAADKGLKLIGLGIPLLLSPMYVDTLNACNDITEMHGSYSIGRVMNKTH